MNDNNIYKVKNILTTTAAILFILQFIGVVKFSELKGVIPLLFLINIIILYFASIKHRKLQE